MKYLLDRIFQQRKKNRFLAFIETWRMRWRNHLTSSPLTDANGPVVSLTTYGARIKTVHLTLESIGRGTVKPSRLILWISHEDKPLSDIPSLRRLVQRGLEIRFCENWGPHKKYFPYVSMAPNFDRPLVTADDDVLYPEWWLDRLAQAHAAHPEFIHCYRAHRIAVSNGAIASYRTWLPCSSDKPTFLSFATGVSGVIYPESFQRIAQAAGTQFTEYCPQADDVWLHYLAVTSNHEIRQIQPNPVHFVEIRGARASALHFSNVKGGGNDVQILKTYSPEAIAKLSQHAAARPEVLE